MKKTFAQELIHGLPPDLAAKNPEARAALGLLDQQRVAGVPPAQQAALTRELEARGARRRQGAKAQRAGRSLERWLEEQHEEAQELGLVAWIGHFGPPTVRRGPSGADIRVVGKGPADYCGQAFDGRALVVEAKSIEGLLYLDPPPSCGKDRQTIPAHQVEHLDACASGGGVALLVVEHRAENGASQIAAVPWREVPWHTRRGGARRSIGAEDVARWAVRPLGVYLERFLGRLDAALDGVAELAHRESDLEEKLARARRDLEHERASSHLVLQRHERLERAVLALLGADEAGARVALEELELLVAGFVRVERADGGPERWVDGDAGGEQLPRQSALELARKDRASRAA